MRGLIAVDFREDVAGNPLITEINIRHVAFTSAFAAAGFNLVEAQIFATLGQPECTGPLDTMFPPRNLILRDIDGLPLWIEDHTDLKVGECFPERF